MAVGQFGPPAILFNVALCYNVIIDDVEACTLVDSGAMAHLMSSVYAEARGFDVRPISELSDRYVNLNLALVYSSTVTRYVEYNLHVRGISSYDSDHVSLIAKEDTQFLKEVPLTIGMKTEDSIFEARKEGEIDLLDNIWKQVKNNCSLSKLREEFGLSQRQQGKKPLSLKIAHLSPTGEWRTFLSWMNWSVQSEQKSFLLGLAKP